MKQMKRDETNWRAVRAEHNAEACRSHRWTRWQMTKQKKQKKPNQPVESWSKWQMERQMTCIDNWGVNHTTIDFALCHPLPVLLPILSVFNSSLLRWAERFTGHVGHSANGAATDPNSSERIGRAFSELVSHGEFSFGLDHIGRLVGWLFRIVQGDFLEG